MQFFLDLSQAFDSVPHHLLIHKLATYGFYGRLYLWINDYLKQRTQAVVCEGCKSKRKQVISGVPQGSILGPYFLPCTSMIL